MEVPLQLAPYLTVGCDSYSGSSPKIISYFFHYIALLLFSFATCTRAHTHPSCVSRLAHFSVHPANFQQVIFSPRSSLVRAAILLKKGRAKFTPLKNKALSGLKKEGSACRDCCQKDRPSRSPAPWSTWEHTVECHELNREKLRCCCLWRESRNSATHAEESRRGEIRASLNVRGKEPE